MLDELITEIKNKGLRIGDWQLLQSPECDHLLIADVVRGGWYKFGKTYEPHIIQGVKDPGPSNGKKLNPLAVLGISPCGKVEGSQKTFVTSLF